MKAICPRTTLLEACQLVGVATAVREIKPILRNLKAIADGSRFTLMATDLEIGIRHELRSLTVQEGGEAILPASKLISILRESTDDELVVEADENKVLVRGNVNEFEMPSENPADFPDIPTFSDQQYHEVPAGALRHMIRRTIFAAAKESGKFAITGILWEVEAKHLRLVATDTKRLAQMTGPVSSHDAGDTKGQSHLVPTKAMQLLERHLQEPGRRRTGARRFAAQRGTLPDRHHDDLQPARGRTLSALPRDLPEEDRRENLVASADVPDGGAAGRHHD